MSLKLTSAIGLAILAPFIGLLSGRLMFLGLMEFASRIGISDQPEHPGAMFSLAGVLGSAVGVIVFGVQCVPIVSELTRMIDGKAGRG